MKRYKVVTFDFDSRPSLLRLEIQGFWDEKVKDLHKKNKEISLDSLVYQYGETDKKKKIDNFKELGDKPASIIAYHNQFLHQIRDAFVIGAYYPALVGACTLGERILNHLISALKDDYKGNAFYKKIYSKASIDDWLLAIKILESWDVLLPSTAKVFSELMDIRHKAVHFDPIVDLNDRVLALDAIEKIQDIIGQQFSAFGRQPWFITDVPGEIYIKKEYESNPFIKKIYIPNCLLVGPNHTTTADEQGRFIIVDNSSYPDKAISDEEFVEYRKNQKFT